MMAATMSAPNTGDNGYAYMQPALPHLVSILAFAVHRQMNQAELLLPSHWTDEDNFVPFNFTVANPTATLWGINFDKDPATAVAPHDRFLSASGMTYPFVTDIQGLLGARKSWMNSNFNQVPVLPCNFGANQGTVATSPANVTVNGTTRINSLDQFLLMPKDADSTFFEKLIENAAIHARCFKGQQNLSQIPTVGGSETLILCTYQLNANVVTHPNYNLDITQANKLTWYRNSFPNMRATFNTMIANPPRAETLQAFTFGINATLPVTGMFNARTAIGYTPFTAPHQYRTGPIWTHSSRKMEYRDEDGQKGKEMFKYFGRIIHANLWNERL